MTRSHERHKSNDRSTTAKRIVIVGGSFAGGTLAPRLEGLAPAKTEIVLSSSENHFVFTPLLAETVGREISPLHVVVPGRQMVHRARWLTTEVAKVDRAANTVHYVSRGGERGALGYDHLVIACGSVVNFNLIPGLAVHAYPLKSLGDAVFLGNDLIGRLEEAAVQPDPAKRQHLLTVVAIGGGFSGVEVAGAVNDLMERTRRFYPQLRDIRPSVIFLQHGERILPEFGAASLSEYALKKLRAHGIEVRLNAGAQEVTSREVVLDSGERIQAGTEISTVGNTSNPLLWTLGLPLERGRLKTEPDMRVAGCSNVWALGDCALKREVQRSLAVQRGYLSLLDLVEKEPQLLGLRVSDWMSSPAATLSPDMILEQTVIRFHQGRPGYPVTNPQSTLVGYCGRVQLYDALRAALPPDTPLREFLLVDPTAVAEDQHLSDVVAQMAREYVEVLPVLASDRRRRVVGVLSPIDIFLQISHPRTGTATSQPPSHTPGTPAVLGDDSSSTA